MTNTHRRWGTGAALGIALVLGQVGWGCVGFLGDVDGESGAGGGGTTTGPDPETLAGVGDTTRFARLTHEQWDNTVADLFGFDASVPRFSGAFRSDARSGDYLFDNDTAVLSVDQGLQGAYERAAAEIALFVTSDPARLLALVPASGDGPSGGDDAARARSFITEFGERAHRRPLSTEQVDQYVAIYEQGLSAYANSPGFAGGIRLVIEAMLVSPYFLYRTELSDEVVEGTIPLDDWEIASRLSYALWNTMPDTSLFADARAGELRGVEALRSQVERMLEDQRAAPVVARMHAQIFGLARYGLIGPNLTVFPEAPENLESLAQTELELLLASALSTGRNFGDLLTEPRTFVNAETAALYGIQGEFGAEFEEVSLDPSERAGILTLVGFLTSNATSVNPDPIHRGYFIAKSMLCLDIAAPPGDIPPAPIPDPDQTNRQAWEAITEQPGTSCIGCHATGINPFGFPFEMYDAVGSIRDNDRGLPLDLETVAPIGGEMTQITDPLQLMQVLASSEDVYACYAKHVTEYLLGRRSVVADNPFRAAIGSQAADRAAIRDVFVEALISPQFTERPDMPGDAATENGATEN